MPASLPLLSSSCTASPAQCLAPHPHFFNGLSHIKGSARPNTLSAPEPSIMPSDSDAKCVSERRGSLFSVPRGRIRTLSSASSSSSSSPVPSRMLYLPKRTSEPSIRPNPGPVQTKITLPSLCQLIAEPEPHPDFESVMASLGQRSGPGPILRHGRVATTLQKPSIPTIPPLIVPPTPARVQTPTTQRRGRPRGTSYSKGVLPPANAEASEGKITRRASTFDIAPPCPATLYAVNEYQVSAARYSTPADQRGFLPVYEFQLNSHTLMIDMETSFVLLTSMCHAMGHTGASIIRLVESAPDLQPYVRKNDTGIAKIQGLWVPYSLAKELARRTAWVIRFDLVPLFGYSFPTQCLSPNDPGFGNLRLMTSIRRIKRTTKLADSQTPSQSLFAATTAMPPAPHVASGKRSSPIDLSPVSESQPAHRQEVQPWNGVRQPSGQSLFAAAHSSGKPMASSASAP